jgi:VWFA-related protein
VFRECWRLLPPGHVLWKGYVVARMWEGHVNGRVRLVRVLLVTILLTPGFASSLSGQTNTTSAQTGGNAPQQPIQTLNLSARRVVVDVTVTNGEQPVSGLSEDDFRVTEDGVAQKLVSFEAHTTQPQAPAKLPQLPPGTFANLSANPGGVLSVVLYDVLNTPLASQAYARAQLLAFLKRPRSSGQVAVFVLSDKLHLLQGFTDDDNKLIAALNVQKGDSSQYLQSPGQAAAPGDQLARTDGNQNGADARNDASFQGIAGMLQNMQAIESSYLLDRRVEITADALSEISRFLAALPGRKNLIWLSAAFPQGIVPNAEVNGRNPETGRNEFDSQRDYTPQIKEAFDLLASSHVAVYPVDARGLETNSMFSAASNQTFEPGQHKDSRAVQNFGALRAAEHSTMETIATATGGRAFYNGNGIADAIAEADRQASTYYTLSYIPSTKGREQTLRRIHIETTHPGYQLAYRRGYFNSTDHAAATGDAWLAAVQHGAPSAHELFFEVHMDQRGEAHPASDEQKTNLLKYDAFTGKEKKAAKLAVDAPILLQGYLLEFALLPRQLDIEVGPDQARHNHLEFAVLSFDADGNTLSGIRTELQDVIHPDRWQEIEQSGGYHVPLGVEVPVQARFLRIAVRDMSSGRIGSLEVSLPLAKTQ